MRMYIVRHGQSAWNADKRIQGQTDTPLSGEGYKQIERVSSRLGRVTFDAAYSSPLERARLTAEGILKESGLTAVLDDRLKELCFGDWEGQYLDIIQEKDPENWYWYSHDMARMRINGADCYADRVKDAKDFFEMLLSKHSKDEKVLIVSHGAFIRCFLAEIMGIETRAARLFAILNTSVTVADAKKDYLRILTIGDASHLNGSYYDNETV